MQQELAENDPGRQFSAADGSSGSAAETDDMSEWPRQPSDLSALTPLLARHSALLPLTLRQEVRSNKGNFIELNVLTLLSCHLHFQRWNLDVAQVLSHGNNL